MTTEIYQADLEECGEVEILHLSKYMTLEDPDPDVAGIFHREVSYMSDHQVFQRIGRNGDYGTGWNFWKLWDKLEDVYKVGREKQSKGWEVTWHPAHRPGVVKYVQEVAFQQ
jgi:hypothetical protein